MAIVPFTIVFMGATNARLLGLAKKGELSVSERSEGEALLRRWGWLNAVRGMLPLAGAVLAGFLVVA